MHPPTDHRVCWSSVGSVHSPCRASSAVPVDPSRLERYCRDNWHAGLVEFPSLEVAGRVVVIADRVLEAHNLLDAVAQRSPHMPACALLSPVPALFS